MKSRIQVAITGVSVLALAAGLYACGGGGEETVPIGTLTKQQFLKRAEATCVVSLKELNKDDLAAWQKYEPDHTTTDEAVLNQVSLALVPGYEEEVRRIRALGLPKGDERYVYDMLKAWEEGLEEARDDPSLVREAGPGTGLYKSSMMRSKYGLEGC
jgi:hypothetical protein